MTEGCGRTNCSNPNCASNESFVKIPANQAASKAIQLAREKAELCEFSSKSAKQFKPCLSSQEATSSYNANSQHDHEMKKESDDDDEVVYNDSR